MLLTANIFQPLIDVFEAVLKLFHNQLGVPWGWSIVLLTVAIRVIMIPLTVKQFHSMQALQRLGPELKAVQQKYKDDKQRQQQEVMKFYKDNNVNPFGSCLPMVAQLPVFISLFYMLRQSLRADICPQLQHYKLVDGKRVVDLAHTVACGPHGGASFLFVNDLTNKATGIVLIVLIVLYVGTQLASSLMMMSSSTMDPTQRWVMMGMPLFFVFFVISFPAGVIVYWITTNTWTMAQQYILRRRLGPTGPPALASSTLSDPSGSGGGKGGSSGGKGGRSPGLGSNRGSGDRDSRTKDDDPSGSGSSGGSGGLGGLGGLLRGRAKSGEEVAGSAASSRTVVPPPPPRKRKKRSGRRR